MKRVYQISYDEKCVRHYSLNESENINHTKNKIHVKKINLRKIHPRNCIQYESLCFIENTIFECCFQP